MSSAQVREKAKQTLESVRELIIAVKEAMHEELRKKAPNVINALDKQIDKAAKGFSNTLKIIDKKTSKEQLELLKAYRSFLQKQIEMIDSRISSLEREQVK